tara:strand:- start:2545 stop:3294 length:750 start_codon:yes stop_codon:yes gene_type:complete
MTEQEVKEKFDELYTKYQSTMELLVDALDNIEKLKKELDKKPKEVIINKEIEVEKIVEIEVPVEVIKEIIVEKEIEVEVEKVVEVEVPIEVQKETVVTVEKEVPGPERRVEVPGPERRVEVPGPERIIEKINPADKKLKQKNLVLSAEIEELKKQKQEVKEVIVEVPVTEFVETAPEVIEKESSKDLHEAARLMAQSEFNREDLSEEQIYKILIKESEDEVKKKIGFWAMPLPTDTTIPTNKKYTGKKR